MWSFWTWLHQSFRFPWITSSMMLQYFTSLIVKQVIVLTHSFVKLWNQELVQLLKDGIDLVTDSDKAISNLLSYPLHATLTRWLLKFALEFWFCEVTWHDFLFEKFFPNFIVSCGFLSHLTFLLLQLCLSLEVDKP